MTLILGGSGSGKSTLAEKWSDMCRGRFAPKVKGRIPLSYIATLQVGDDPESQARVQRHRLQRANYGFTTYEIPAILGSEFESVEKNGVVLLDCLGNLAANQMFNSDPARGVSEVVSVLTDALINLVKDQMHVIVVSNLIFSDGIVYDDLTLSYREALGRLHQNLAAQADQVVEVVCGEGIFWKGGII